MRALSVCVVTLLLTSSTAIAADPSAQKLLGVWAGSGGASEAIYRTLTITDKHISWPRTNNLPACKTTYEIVSTTSGETFPGQFPMRKPVEGRTFFISKLKLGPEVCNFFIPKFRLRFLQFAIPSGSPESAYVVEYDEADKPHSELSFIRSH